MAGVVHPFISTQFVTMMMKDVVMRRFDIPEILHWRCEFGVALRGCRPTSNASQVRLQIMAQTVVASGARAHGLGYVYIPACVLWHDGRNGDPSPEYVCQIELARGGGHSEWRLASLGGGVMPA